ncbi:hypothetical protein N7539_004722 [Penicillium diatomitis]|uniref:Uncharacterized protein n=1 Tax=Penicillium diatomitis TaxID=2819901 RepID=A0A9W9X5H3_9EURO|nr:uncharacterized protein N7539_004722 [Penicillium diatomitis]KAJ5484734.1 hypothetical protein N7539_004722 [Penicillium diatomitis]
MGSSAVDPESSLPLAMLELIRPQASPPRPQARSAGMAERPSRNENLSDLVRFFQTSEAEPSPRPNPTPIPTSPESTTALPVVAETRPSIEPPTEPTKDAKPLRRRFLQFAQRQKKDSSAKSKLTDNQRQIEALQREGYLLTAPKPKSTRSSRTSISSKNSLERTYSRSKKQDVETIGQPWLETDSKRGSSEFKQHLAPLNLGDFGSMVDVAVSLSKQEEDLSPPPYQPPSSSKITINPGNQGSSDVSAYARPDTDNTLSSPMSTAATHGSPSPQEHARQLSTSTSSTRRILDPDIKPPPRMPRLNSVEFQAGSSTASLVSDGSRSEPFVENLKKPGQASENSSQSSPGGLSSQPSLKLFPDVAPARMPSKNSLNALPIPQYQRSPRPPASANSSTNVSPMGPKSANVRLSDDSSTKSNVEGERKMSGATATSTTSSTSSETQYASSVRSGKTNAPELPISPATMGTLQAFPLPAPTRPLPSLPQPARAPPCIPAAQRVTAELAILPPLKAPESKYPHPSPIAEEPRELTPKDALHYQSSLASRSTIDPESKDEQGSELDSESPSPAYILDVSKSSLSQLGAVGRRAPSIRIPKMQDDREHPSNNEADGLALADSPLLGRANSMEANGKRAARKPLEIDSTNVRLDPTHLPFGLPSPPPTAALPSDPPSQLHPDPSAERRKITASVSAGGRALKAVDGQYNASHHRASMVSRSNSSRSSLRHESIPESTEPSHSESPLPSSDDEGFGPNTGTSRARCAARKIYRLPHSLHQGYATVGSRPSHSRPRYAESVRSQTPQGRMGRSLDKSAISPQSNYSHSTHRSRDSRSSHQTQAAASQMAHFLEDRVAHLERQNQVLQAALFAALNAGGKSPFDGLSDLERSSHMAQPRYTNPYQARFTARPDSWVGSTHSSEHSGGFDPSASCQDNRSHLRQLDNMIEDIEGGWMSDKSSLAGVRMTRPQ